MPLIANLDYLVFYVYTKNSALPDNPIQIHMKFAQWKNDYLEKQISINYDNIFNGTKSLIEVNAKGANLEGPVWL